MTYDLAALERRLNAGEWLRTGEVAALLGVSRGTVHNMLIGGEIGWKRRGGGIQRICNPDDVRRRLARSRTEQRGTAPDQPE